MKATGEVSARAAVPTQAWTSAALIRRVLALDALACPRCGGRLRLIATVQAPAVVRAILTQLGLAPVPATARAHRGHRVPPGGPARLAVGCPVDHDDPGRQRSRLPRSCSP